MKVSITYSFFIACIFFANSLLAQSIKGGLTLGFNASQVDGDEVFGFSKFGLNIGPMAVIPLNKNISISLETLYSQKGSYQSPQRADSLSGEYKLILNYVEVPVLFHYNDKDIFNVGFGFSWAKLVEFKEWEHGAKVNWDTQFGPYKSSDVEVLLDVQFRLTKGLFFDFRYGYSVAKLRTRTFLNNETRKQFNNLLTFRLMYIFNDKPMSKKDKEGKK